HPADRRDDRATEKGGVHHRAGGAEFPLRLDRRRPPLCGRAGQGGRRDRQSRTGSQSREITRLSRRVGSNGASRAATEENDMTKTGFTLASFAASLMATSALAQDITVKLGVLNDRSGVYADLSGEGSVIAARMAVEDFGAADKGINVEIVSADHQNKPDVASTIARQWIDQEGVNAIFDVPTSSAALAINEITKDANALFINSGAAASELTGTACSPHTVHWTYDTWALAHGTGSAMVEQGGDSWFFLTADYAFGHALERDTAAVVEAAGGEVLGTVRHPFPGTDFSSFLLQAQSSGAKVIGLANAGG